MANHAIVVFDGDEVQRRYRCRVFPTLTSCPPMTDPPVTYPVAIPASYARSSGAYRPLPRHPCPNLLLLAALNLCIKHIDNTYISLYLVLVYTFYKIGRLTEYNEYLWGK